MTAAPGMPPEPRPPTGGGPQRLLFLVNDLSFGGAEKHLVTLVNLLDPQEFESHIIRLGPGADLLDQLEPTQLAGTLAVNRTTKVSVAALREVAAYVDRHRISTVVCVNEYPMIYAYLARRRAAATPRLVEIFHTTDLVGRGDGLRMRLVYRRLFARFDAVVFVSHRQQSTWIDERGLRVRHPVTIHNGIDEDYFRDSPDLPLAAEVRASFGPGPQEYLVGVCAALRPEKRHIDVVSAVARLVDEGVQARLLLIGDGPQRSQIETRAAELGIASRVRVTGFQPDVRPFLSVCDSIALASSKETFSLAVLEAMALGKPVVCSDVGGASEQVDHGVTGYLFADGDVAELADRLRDLTDPVLRGSLGRAARRRVEEDFTVGRMVERYQQLFRSMRG